MVINIIKYDTLSSTNEEAKKLAEAGCAEGAVIYAKTQTGGKGRLGNKWYSPEGGGLYMSMVLRPGNISEASKITITAAVAVSEVLNAKIKWVNDIILNKKKVCGILAESSPRQNNNTPKFVVLGVGVNLNNKSFPDELAEKATSLYCETGVFFNIENVLGCIITSFSNYYKTLLNGGFGYILDKYRQNCISLGNEIQYTTNGITSYGYASGIGNDGGLIVQTENGEITLHSGEAKVRTLCGGGGYSYI